MNPGLPISPTLSHSLHHTGLLLGPLCQEGGGGSTRCACFGGGLDSDLKSCTSPIFVTANINRISDEATGFLVGWLVLGDLILIAPTQRVTVNNNVPVFAYVHLLSPGSSMGYHLMPPDGPGLSDIFPSKSVLAHCPWLGL